MYHLALVYTETNENLHGAQQMNETVRAIESALKFKGHRVTLIPASIHMLSEIERIGTIDVIFNACTGINNKREQANVVAMLEVLDIPFVGSPLSAQIMGIHKSLAKRIFKSVGVPVTNFQVFRTGEEVLDESLKFPLIVKPEHEGSSLGITGDSVVFNNEELYKRINKVIKEFNQPALVEEFVAGREFTIGVLGTSNPRVLPMIEILYTNEEGFYTVEIKAEDQAGQVCPPDLSEKKTAELKDYALRAYKALGCSEFARLDVRMDKHENPYFIEINTLPGMQPGYSDFPKMANAAGYDYNELIEELLKDAVNNKKY
jgi:D-alanine-D-alanine ligase